MNIRKIAEEAVRLYFDGYSAHEAIEKAKEMYGYEYGAGEKVHCHRDMHRTDKSYAMVRRLCGEGGVKR